MVEEVCMAERGRAWQERRPLQRTARILLECILVFTAPTKLRQGYIFTGICHSVNREGAIPACLAAGLQGEGLLPGGGCGLLIEGGLLVWFGGAEGHNRRPPHQKAITEGGAWWRHLPPPGDGYCCGRYASYWNAFL